MSGWCKTCGDFMLYDTHRCPPKWIVWHLENDETEDDGSTAIYAHDAGAAAEKWADNNDHHMDYAIVSGDVATLAVRRDMYDADEHENPVTYHAVSGESVPQYSSQLMGREDFKRELKRLADRRSFWQAGKLYGRMLEMNFHTRSEPTT